MIRRARRSAIIGILASALGACVVPSVSSSPSANEYSSPLEKAPIKEELPADFDPLPTLETADRPSFDPHTVTEELRTATIVDVRSLIDRLNTIIQRQDYEGWLPNLTEDYRMIYSDPVILARMSESPVLKRLGIRLNSLRDYFLYVVYPSRQNDRVDDVEFLGKDDIRAITVNSKGERLVLYHLERINDTWKIGIGR